MILSTGSKSESAIKQPCKLLNQVICSYAVSQDNGAIEVWDYMSVGVFYVNPMGPPLASFPLSPWNNSGQESPF